MLVGLTGEIVDVTVEVSNVGSFVTNVVVDIIGVTANSIRNVKLLRF